MKKISTLCLLIVAAFLVSAQSYRPFPEYGHFWNEEHGRLLPGTCGFEYHTCDHPIYFGTDTIINSVVYLRLYQRQICEWQATIPPTPPCLFSGYYNYSESLFACIRQDTVLRKVYVYDTVNNVEALLYDFSLSPGDIIPQAYNNPDYPNVLVARVDSVMLSDGYHKRFVLNVTTLSLDSIAIIEGVGSTVGLLSALAMPFEHHDLLLCFGNSTHTIYPNASASCTIALGIPSIPVQSFEILPNPCSDFVEISVSQPGSNSTLKIFQPDGRLVLDQRIETEKTRVQLPDLSKGIYIVKLESAQGIRTKLLTRQ